MKSCDNMLAEVGFHSGDSESHSFGSFEGSWSDGGNTDWMQLGGMTVDSCKAWTCTFCQNAMGTLDWMKEDTELQQGSRQQGGSKILKDIRLMKQLIHFRPL